MIETQNKMFFATTEDQQKVLGLPATPAFYAPHEFTELAGRAMLVHNVHAETAETIKGKDRREHLTNAGIAQSVVVGVLRKVVELGGEYDAIVQAPRPMVEQPRVVDYEPKDMPVEFSMNVLVHYNMAAARRIQEVRQAQELQLSYDQAAAL
ncbi:MAG: hypothetical protein JWP13_203 [Candidatus Saccharibacteria bacterium]|nr:hypothetical protein [Candidatus Saccharibacteria bacterium]